MNPRRSAPHNTVIQLAPFEPWAALQGFACSVRMRRRGRLLLLYYSVRGPLEQLAIPSAADAAGFTPGLWHSTCMECFVRSGNSTAYTEWNVSPSGNWWTCNFISCRSPAPRQSDGMRPQRIRARQSGATLAVHSALPLMHDAPTAIAPAVILEHTNGARSHWAQALPFEQPDFHRLFSVACEL